jgi:hypothetical protein
MFFAMQFMQDREKEGCWYITKGYVFNKEAFIYINCKYIGGRNLREQTKHCKGENLTRRFQPAFYFEDNWIYLDQELVRTLLLT